MGLGLAAATASFDQMSPFGGALVKAKFLCYPGSGDDPLTGEASEVPFFLNPATIRVEKAMTLEDAPAVQTTLAVRYAHTDPIVVTLGELWFDTYDTRESVRERYIDALEALLDYDVDTHHPNVVVFVFGEFSQRTRHRVTYTFFIEKLTVDYTMFLADGTPVRAKVSVTLRQLVPPTVVERLLPKRASGAARLHNVTRGDTLERIATRAYGTPTEWRRIADANGIDDPMTLTPGRPLLLPPIIR